MELTVPLTLELLETVLMTTVMLQGLPTLSTTLTKSPESFEPATINWA